MARDFAPLWNPCSVVGLSRETLDMLVLYEVDIEDREDFNALYTLHHLDVGSPDYFRRKRVMRANRGEKISQEQIRRNATARRRYQANKGRGSKAKGQGPSVFPYKRTEDKE